MNSGEIPREMLGYSPRTSREFSNEFPAKAREIPGDFLAKFSAKYLGNPDVFVWRFLGKSQGKPLATIPLVWASDEGLDKTPRNFSEIFQGRPPGIAQDPPKKFA